jgi:DNA-damage-inducible protein D
LFPKNLPPAEDVRKLQRKLNADEKKLLSETKKKRKI